MAFIVGQGTIGGTLMDVGFDLYGALMVLSATMSYLHARPGPMAEFSDWLDALMVFFFYISNLIVAEFVIRAGRQKRTGSADLSVSALFVAASAFIAFVIWMFAANTWGPKIASGLTL
ncbi:hypothetical protein J2857_004966 [Neorhizobium galegae]|uniref:hypothetical protein n=1 Tax=Neorhizobium galegae TaxID=399 RepID=UPI001AE35D92|nr:hypothetical protein [Neorhizobium galegae]MBP2562175.1 hypothetical protein [Neorhizobium galegae]